MSKQQPPSPDERDRSSPSTPLCQRITVRLSDSERWVVESLAKQAGLSVGRFIVAAVQIVAKSRIKQIAGVIGSSRKLERGRRRRKRAVAANPEPSQTLGTFRCPFMRREDAEGFQRVISRSAKRMGISELSSARYVSFFLEEIAVAVTEGEIVRLPGFGAFGPWHTENAKGVDDNVPRFVAAQPFREHVQWNSSSRLNRNRELQALRRRRRARHSSVLDALETFRIHIRSQNRDAQAAFERWIELDL